MTSFKIFILTFSLSPNAQLIAGTAEGRLGGSGVFSGASLSGGLSIFEVEPGLNLMQILK